MVCSLITMVCLSLGALAEAEGAAAAAEAEGAAAEAEDAAEAEAEDVAVLAVHGARAEMAAHGDLPVQQEGLVPFTDCLHNCPPHIYNVESVQ